MNDYNDFEQFLEDVEFMKEHKDSWIFTPLYALARRLVLFHEKFYENVNL